MSFPNNDLLSAFHDGEITAAERAVVEQQLATSADARRELSEIKQVSALLKELPRDRLPSEFPQQVLQAIEREMLIPSQPTDAAETSAAKASRSRRWISAAALLTSAAGLFLLVRALEDGAGRGVSDDQRLASSLTMQSAPAEFAADSPMPMAVDGSRSLDRENEAAAGATSLGGFANRARVAGGENLYFDQSTLGDAEIGDVIRAIQRTEGDEVAVVYLTVVDRRPGLDNFQLLLTRNKIARSEGESEPIASRLAVPSEGADEMQAVLVKADAAQLETALEELRKEKYLRSLEVDQPILLAELSEAPNGRAYAADKTISDSVKREEAKSLSEAATSARRSKAAPADAIEKKLTKAPAPAPADKPAGPPAKASESRDAKEPFAKQYRFGLSSQALQQNQLAQQNRARDVSKETLRGQAAAKKDVEPAAEQRPLQVLFVVVDQSQAGKQQPPASNSSKPTGPPAKTRKPPAKPNGQDGAA